MSVYIGSTAIRRDRQIELVDHLVFSGIILYWHETMLHALSRVPSIPGVPVTPSGMGPATGVPVIQES